MQSNNARISIKAKIIIQLKYIYFLFLSHTFAHRLMSCIGYWQWCAKAEVCPVMEGISMGLNIR